MIKNIKHNNKHKRKHPPNIPQEYKPNQPYSLHCCPYFERRTSAMWQNNSEWWWNNVLLFVGLRECKMYTSINKIIQSNIDVASVNLDMYETDLWPKMTIYFFSRYVFLGTLSILNNAMVKLKIVLRAPKGPYVGLKGEKLRPLRRGITVG